MQNVLIVAPSDAVISLAEMKSHLAYEDTDKDVLIQAMIDAAVAGVDPALGGTLGRALRPQTWEMQLQGFPCNDPDRGEGRSTSLSIAAIELPFPPLISVSSVKYDDFAGVEQTLTENTDFKVFGIGGRGKQSIKPLYLGYWPLARPYPGSVRIRFQSGYPTPVGNAADTLPAAIKSYVKLAVADLFANREAVQVTNASAVENPTFARLLDPSRIF